MVKINRKRVGANYGDRDIKIDRNSIGADQFLEVITARGVHIGSLECSGMKILAEKIFFDGEITSSGPIILAAMEIYINREAAVI
jgi:hypothetical protein